MFCKNLLKRQKQYKPFWYCKIKRQQVILNECKKCLEFNLKRNKAIKKASNKRITVSKETYNQVFKRDNESCVLCKTTLDLELHHILYRSEAKMLIDEPANCCMLCNKHHIMVHQNKKMWQPVLSELIKKKV